jgi:hypothetical protein
MTVILPQCYICTHYHGSSDGEHTCDAFLERIPGVIFADEFYHIKPYPGDHGVRFEYVRKNVMN